MKILFLVALMAALMAVVSATATDATDANFDEVIKSAEIVLMEFYAPWCGHCKKLAPEWDAAAATLKADGVNAVLAKMDATAEKTTPEKFEIRGYPTIKIFRNGAVSGEYEGKRDAAGIVQWVKANIGPAFTTIESAEQLDALKKEDLVLTVLYAAAEGPAFEVFKKVAEAQRSQVRFAVAPTAALQGDNAGKIVVYKHFDDKETTYTGSLEDAKELSSFVSTSAMRSFQEMGPENYKSYIDRGLPIAWLFVKPNEKETSAGPMAAFETLAKELKGKMSLVWIDASKYGGMAQRMGLKGTNFPSAVIDYQNKHYAFDESAAITEESARKFFSDYTSGTLKQSIRSQDEPAQNPTKGLWTIVGTNFESIVQNNADYDIIIKFYAPWCGHCKALAPAWEELAGLLADTKGIRVAKFDASNNDFDNAFYKVAGYPTILFVKKGTKEPVAYEGDRTTQAFIDYLKKESSADLSNIGAPKKTEGNEEL